MEVNDILTSSSPSPVGSRRIITRGFSSFDLEKLRTHSDPNLPLKSLSIEGKVQTKSLASTLSSHKNLQHLNLKGNSLKKKGAEELVAGLQSNQDMPLTELILSGNELESEGAQVVLESISNLKSLQTLDIQKNKIKKDGLRSIGHTLQHTNSLRQLNVSDNPKIGKEGLEYLCEGLKNNETLHVLNAGIIGMGPKGSSVLAKTLAANQTLTVLNVQGNAIKDEGFTALTQALLQNTSIRELDVSQNGITKKSIQLILALLHRHPPIQSLNLSHNKLGSSISSIADALSTNKTLLKLYLQNTELKTEGAVALFVSLRFNNKLVHLDVSMNKIGDKSGPAILDLIKDNMALQVLNMNFNQIRNGIEGIGVELANNNTLVELYLSNNPISSDVGFDIALGLRRNMTLKLLEMKETDINMDRSQALLQTYEESLTLEKMWVNVHFYVSKKINYSIPNLKLRSFPVALLKMTHLQVLNLNDNYITDIPPAIVELTSLQELFLCNNMIELLPNSLCLMTNLKTLNVDGNPLKVPPKEIVKKGAKEILSYLHELQAGSETVFRTKLMVVGQGSSLGGCS